jgi:hypothetical protein
MMMIIMRMMIMMLMMTIICCTADGAPGLVKAANVALASVAKFIGEQPANPSFSKGLALSKEHALRSLMFVIEGRGPLTPETYEKKMGEMWPALKIIVTRRGGPEAFQDAEGDSWALSMLKNGPLHVKVCHCALKLVVTPRVARGCVDSR